MVQTGFGEKWCKWIDTCLQSSTISILVNGSLTQEFSMGRRVRQGDPISPFLFLIVTEGLNVVINEAVRQGHYKGTLVGNNKVSLSHLQYADDTIFFGEGNMINAKKLMGIMEYFYQATGLKINMSKSKVFGIGVSNEEILSFSCGMGCVPGSLPFDYLGLPIRLNMRRRESWSKITEKFKNKLSEWKSKNLSYGGRWTLVKSVLGSLSLYFFSLFRAPISVIDTLESIRRTFFWGGNDEKENFHG